MSIENNIFKRFSPNFESLQEYGFVKNNNSYDIEKFFMNNSFKASIEISETGDIKGKVYDLESNDEYLPLRVPNNEGKYINHVRIAYEELLINIRDECFFKKYYIYPQSNRITNLIIEKYGDKPEFLWKTSPGSGIFRNKDSKKWYLAILDVDRSKLQPNRKGLVEVANIKLATGNVQNAILQQHIYPAYHMNKKNWISVILDDTLSDEVLMELISESYKLSNKKALKQK